MRRDDFRAKRRMKEEEKSKRSYTFGKIAQDSKRVPDRPGGAKKVRNNFLSPDVGGGGQAVYGEP
jgi:hypothetical protein